MCLLVGCQLDHGGQTRTFTEMRNMQKWGGDAEWPEARLAWSAPQTCPRRLYSAVRI